VQPCWFLPRIFWGLAPHFLMTGLRCHWSSWEAEQHPRLLTDGRGLENSRAESKEDFGWAGVVKPGAGDGSDNSHCR
jgi:hypothetical protein